MDIEKLNGLEFMKSLLEKRISPPSITETMPMEVAEVSSGYVKFTAKADKRHMNPFGAVHGGFAATVLDSVTACAVHTVLEAGIGFSTLDLNIKMVKPVPLERELVAEGRVIHLSNKLGMSEGTLKDAHGNLYAHATAICMIYKKK